MILALPTDDLRTATWIDLVEPSLDEIERVQTATWLRVPAEAQSREIESTSLLAFEKGAFYLSTSLVGNEDGAGHCLVRGLSAAERGGGVMDGGFEGAPEVNAARLHAISTDVSSLTDWWSAFRRCSSPASTA